MILERGVIHTMDAALPRVSALAITRDGRVARGVEAWEGDGSQVSTERIDLDGRVVVPGLADAHIHFRTWALERTWIDLAACRSADECAALVAQTPGDGPIVAAGFREDALGGPPTRQALDDVLGRRPATLWAHDRHTLWMNTAALALAGIDAASAPPPGGVIERGVDGQPTGVLRETAAWAVDLPEPSTAAQLAAVRAAQREAHALGITTIHDFERRGGLSLWHELHADRELTLRVEASRPADDLDAVLASELRHGFGDEVLRIGHIKGFVDGTLGSRTAAMLAPYADGGDGMLLLSADDLERVIVRAAAGGLPVALHAIGDRANRLALDAFARTRDAWADLPAPPRIEHAQLLHPDDLARFATLGVAASMQPSHLISDRATAAAVWGDRCDGAYAWRPLADSGAVLAFGSDAPIERPGPLTEIAAAVTRAAAGDAPWHPELALDAHRALAASTIGPAAAAGRATALGRLVPGAHADLVVLDGDPLTVAPDDLRTLRVVATMVGGRWVHGRPPW